MLIKGAPVTVPETIRAVLAGGTDLPDGAAAVATLARTLAKALGGRLELAAVEGEARLSFLPL